MNVYIESELGAKKHDLHEKKLHFTADKTRIFGGRENAYGDCENRAIREKFIGGSVDYQFRAPIRRRILLPACGRVWRHRAFASSRKKLF